MTKFQEALNRIRNNKLLREEGKQICIPYPFKRLREILPGIERGQHIGTTAGSGISKSKFTRFVFVYSVYNYIKNNPDCGIKPKIFLFLLEDPASRVINNMICHRLMEKYRIKVSLQELESKSSVLQDHVLQKIEECNEYFEDFEKYVTIIDTVYNPFGLYKEVRDYLELTGKTEFETVKGEEGKEEKVPVKYTPNDPESHVIVICDNLSNLNPEKKHKNLKEAIDEWVDKYSRRYLCKFFNCTVVNIQQQDLDSQKMSFSSYEGKPIKSKVKPSLGSLGDSKTTVRSYHVVFGLFSPDRFEFEEDLGYDITLLQNNYRNLSILKSNESDCGYEIGLYFDGASETFYELPHSKLQRTELNQFYERFKQRSK